MKYIIYILFFVCFGLSVKAQVPTGFPSQRWAGWIEPTYVVPDSGTIITKRDTNFIPRFVGTMVTWQHAGVDTVNWFWTGVKWNRVSAAQLDTTSLSNRINLKLNITDTVGKWLSQTSRLVDTVYRVNDSTVGYTIKGQARTFQILGRLPSGGTGTLTSVGLSMPAAFTVSGSPLTGAGGTINVSGAGTSSQYIRGDGTLATMDTTAIPSFFTKVRSQFSATSPITYNSTAGIFGILNANTSGQKGAATFTNSDFTDNGLGLIGLSDLSDGSCLNCQLTISKGRISSFADGSIFLLSNAPGAGDTLVVSGDTIKRIYAGYGLISTPTASSIALRVDTTLIQKLITANNGLTKTGNNIQLGGTLVQSTPITVGTNDLSIVAANGTTSTTRFTIDNTNTVISGRYEDFSSINTIYTNQDNIQIVSTQPTGARRILIDSTTGITIGENVSGVYKGIIFKKGTSQLQANGYTGSTFQTTDTSFNSLVVDGSGNIFKRAGGSGGSADSSIFSTNFRRDTAVLDIRKHYPKVYNIVDYGAKGDGKENTTASISSSSATLTCTTCGFTSADVGKWIRINRAGVSSQDLVTTIITFTNSTTVTINTTASTSVSADTVIWGTNNVPFIQSALNDANNNGGDGIVLIPPPGNGNFYVLGGNLDHSGGDCNCQIKIPVAGVRDTSFNHRKSIIIDGLVPPNHTPSALFADTTTPKENTTLVSIIHGSGTRPSVFSSIDTSFLFANGINYNLITIKNIALFVERNRTGGGPDIGGINFYNMSSSPLENVVVGINGPIHGTQQPTNEVAGIIAGQLSSEIYTSMKDVSVFGFKYGLVLTEAVSLDHVIAHACVNGLTMIHGNYPVVGGYVDAHWCKNSVYVPQSTILGNISPGLTYFNFQNLALEVFQGSSLGAPAWLNYTYIISDSGDNGRGHIYGYTLGHAEVGIDNSMFNKFGGDSIFVYQTGSAVDRNTHIYAGLTQYAGWQNGGLTNYWYNWSPLNDVSIMRLSPVSPGSQAIYLSPNSTGGSGGVPKSWINLFNTALWTGVNTTSSNTELLQIAAAGTSGYNITSAQSGSGTIRDINIGNSNFTTQLKIGATGSTSINTTADDAFVVNGNSSNRSSVVINDANANGNASLYVQNDRGSFASYGGMLIGGSSIASTLFGLTRADKTFLIHDGANGLGMAVGTLQSTPLILGTNNSERFRIDGSTGQLKAAAYGTGVLSGTPAYSPQFDASGNILEKPIPYSLYYSDTSATTVTNTTTETSIVGNVIGSTSFNGGLLIPGSVIRLKGYGYLSTDATPGNLTINFIVSNFTLGITISTLLPAGITNSDIDYEFEVTPFGLGTNQDMFYIGKIDIVNNTTGALVTQRFQGKGQITTTGTLSTDVTAKWSTASTNNILNDRNNVLEIRRIQ